MAVFKLGSKNDLSLLVLDNPMLYYYLGFLLAQMVKNQPAVLEMQVQSLHRGDPLEKGMATRCSILAWRIPWTEEPGRLQSMGLHRFGHDWSNLA